MLALTSAGLLLWLLNRHAPSRKGFHGFVGNALVRMEASFLPGRDHIVEAIERDDAEDAEQGEPSDTKRSE